MPQEARRNQDKTIQLAIQHHMDEKVHAPKAWHLKRIFVSPVFHKIVKKNVKIFNGNLFILIYSQRLYKALI